MDPRFSIQGRGAYVCRSADCIRRAKESDGIARSLKVKIPDSVYIQLAEALNESSAKDADSLVGFAMRSGNAVPGTTAVEQAVKKGLIRLILVDRDAGPQTKKRMERIQLNQQIPFRPFNGKRPLADVTGKPNCKCVGIADRHFAEAILKAMDERKE